MILEYKETFQVWRQGEGMDDARTPYGTALHSIEKVRKRLKVVESLYPGKLTKVTQTTIITRIIDADKFNK
jgi:hypothetical protein